METQVHGTVLISFLNRDFRTVGRTFPAEVRRLTAGLPVRVSALHLCIGENDPILEMAAAAALLAFQAARIRARVHKGSTIECQYALATFGVPSESLPITYSGAVKNKYHVQWIGARRIIEQSYYTSGPIIHEAIVDCPRANDVLFRVGERGTHRGNIRFRELMEQRWEQYRSTSSRHGKDVIVWEIVEAARGMHGRFLSWDTRGWWTEMTDPSTIKKHVVSFIRDYNKRLSAKRYRPKGG